MARSHDSQPTLFELPPRRIEPVAADPEQLRLSRLLPDNVRLGAMTWSYRGWIGIVFGADASERSLAQHGLTAYAQHPLLHIAELDRTYYEPLSMQAYRAYAVQVPERFRFFVKAHEDCTVRRYPLHARYGNKRGLDNALFLDPTYASRVVIAPMAEGLGDKLGAVLFQFPPQDASAPQGFALQLHGFLKRLPRGITYAVELRNPELLTRDYMAALEDTGAVHCHNIWTAMPGVLAQAKLVPPPARRPLIVRWLLRRGDGFADAQARYAPFDRVIDEDLDNRAALASLVARASAHGVPVFVLVDNKAEGCAPESVVRLARAIVERVARADG